MDVQDLIDKLEEMRDRAAFELEGYARVGYEDAVDDLLAWVEEVEDGSSSS